MRGFGSGVAKNPAFTLKNAAKIFPAAYTKVRQEDLINIVVEKAHLLTANEKEMLEKLADKLPHDAFEEKEFIAKRRGRIVRLVRL